MSGPVHWRDRKPAGRRLPGARKFARERRDGPL